MALRKNILLLFLAGFAVLVASGMITYKNLLGWSRDNQSVIHTQEVMVEIGEVRSLFRFAVNRRQSYLITGDKHYLIALEAILGPRRDHLSALRKLISDNPDQQKRLDEFYSLADAQDRVYEKSIQSWKKIKKDQAPQIAWTREIDGYAEEIRDLAIAMSQVEKDLLAKRIVESTRSFHQTLLSFGMTFLGAFALLFAALYLLGRNTRAQDRLRQTELRLSTVIQNAPLILYSLDPKGVVTLSTGKGLEAIGLKPEGSMGKSVFDVYPKNSSILDKIRKALGGEEASGLVEVNGFTVEALYKPIKDAQGRVTEVVGVAIDVTARRKAEAVIEEKTRLLNSIMESMSEGIVVADKDGKMIYFNPSAKRIIGLGISSKKTSEWAKEYGVFKEDQTTPYAEEDLPLVQAVRGRSVNGQIQFLRNPGHPEGIFISVDGTPLKNALGEVDGGLVVVRDIAREKKLEEVTRAQNFVTSILENVPNMIFVKDAKDLRFVMFNKAGEELLGYSRGDLIGKNDHDFFPKADADAFISKDRKVLEGKKLLDIPEEVLKTRLKGERILHTKKIPIRDKDGNALYLLGISEDITEQKERENLRIYAKVLENSNQELQDFIFVASHDLQEPLRKIQSFGNFLKEELGGSISTTATDYLGRVQEDAARRMSILLEDLLELTRVTTRAKPFLPVDLSNVLKEVLSDLEMKLRESGGKVEFGVLPRLNADESQMRQLFQNLISNALKFHKPGVPPLIRVEGEEDSAKGVCHLRVKDNGIGFDQKYADKIFNIFQRLHGQEQYEGTGIGLAICRKVAERHGGKIAASSKIGEGAVFEITLPSHQIQSGEEK